MDAGQLNRSPPHCRELENGLTRYGVQSERSPFLFRGQSNLPEEALDEHKARAEDVRILDEQGNEPIVESVEEWKANPREVDFPFVDTIPLERYLERSLTELQRAKAADVVDELVYVNREWANGEHKNGTIELDCVDKLSQFPFERTCVVLAHEIGHAVYSAYIPDIGTNPEKEKPLVFTTDREQTHVQALSQRMRGRIPDDATLMSPPIYDDAAYRLLEEELFADAYCSRVLEPSAIYREYNNIAATVDDVAGDVSSRLLPDPCETIEPCS